MDLEKSSVQELIATFGHSDKDTGNTKVQIALLTKRINHLSNHLKIHKKDHDNTNSLLSMVGKRKNLLKYLQNKNLEEYRTLIKQLSLRH